MKVFLDSDALFALYVASDVHHKKAKQILKKLLEDKTELLTTNLVIQETATVISYRFGQKQAKDFLVRFSKIGVKQIFTNEGPTAKAWEIFKKQKKKGTSFIDCANVAFCREMKIGKIFSFDKIYKRLGLEPLNNSQKRPESSP